MTENELFDIFKNFDYSFIEKIETTFLNAGFLNKQDYDIIINLFEQVGTTSSADSLSTSIETLANANIGHLHIVFTGFLE